MVLPAGLCHYYKALSLISSDYCWNFLRSPKLFLESSCSSKLQVTFLPNNAIHLFLDQEINLFGYKILSGSRRGSAETSLQGSGHAVGVEWLPAAICRLPESGQGTHHLLSRCASVTAAGDKRLEASNVLTWSPVPGHCPFAKPMCNTPRCFSARSPFQEAWECHL